MLVNGRTVFFTVWTFHILLLLSCVRSLSMRKQMNTDKSGSNAITDAFVKDNAGGVDNFDLDIFTDSKAATRKKPVVEVSKDINVVYGSQAVLTCEVAAYPQPSISWTNGDGAVLPTQTVAVHPHLHVNHLSLLDVRKDEIYRCTAVNELGSETKTISVTVQGIPIAAPYSDELVYINKTQFIRMLLGSTKNIKCDLKFSDPHSIKWLINGKDIRFSGSHMPLVGVTLANEGNYTCVDINSDGLDSVTYVVGVGYPPVFKTSAKITTLDWDGGEYLKSVHCEVEAKPEPKIEWFYNGKPMSDTNGSSVPILDWGTYTCRASNVHGNDQRDFKVTSSGCLINRTADSWETLPLMLTENSTWYKFETANDFLVMRSNDELKLSCNLRARSAFCKSEVTATCVHEDKFLVNGKLFKFTDLRCNERVEPEIIKTGVRCLNETTETIHVGFNLDSFLDVYEVCFDNTNNVPLYTFSRMSNKTLSKEFTRDWYRVPDIDGKSNYKDESCAEDASGCYGKCQLVNARFVHYGPAQNSTFIEQLNSIPCWKPSKGSERVSWHALEELARYKTSEGDVAIWSGASKYDPITNIPRYLWKVMRSLIPVPLAVIYVNAETPDDSDILCTNMCSANSTSWLQVKDKFTYCCVLPEFLNALGLPGTVFERLNY